MNVDATLSLNDLTLDGGNGGAIIDAGTLTVTNSTFSGNSGTDGGAIHSNAGGSGALTVTNSTFSGNSATEFGGAIDNAGSNSMTVTDCTFSANSALVDGSNIYSAGGTVTVINSILSTSSSNNCLGITDGGYNISYNSSGSDTSCGFTGTSVNNVNPRLDPSGLENNGGPTETIALQAGSPAIAAVLPASCTVSTDQRGDPRPAAGQTNCDIGAFESGTVTLTGSVQATIAGISGSTVTLYAAGRSGYGSGAAVLGTATTVSGGSFSLTFAVPAGNPQTYITATGGSVGAYSSNSAIGLMAALGPANSLSATTTITINEADHRCGRVVADAIPRFDRALPGRAADQHAGVAECLHRLRQPGGHKFDQFVGER